MSRHFVLGTWANADEYDYSGEQLMGHRQGKSICMDHMLPSGMANLKRYGDPVSTVTKTPTKPKLTAFDKICTADRTYSRLSALSEELDNQLEGGEIDLESWAYARKQLDKKLEKAWSAVCRLRNWNESGEPLDNHLDSGLSFSLDDIQEARDIGEKQRVKRELTGNQVFDSLSQNNVFLGLFIKVKKIMKIMKALNNWEK